MPQKQQEDAFTLGKEKEQHLVWEGGPTKCKMKSMQIKSQALKWTWKKKSMQAAVRNKGQHKKAAANTPT